jgi:peptidoglycan DL-endopeptidase CwlO
MSPVQRLLRVLLCGAVAVGVSLPASVALAAPSPEEIQQQIEKAHSDLEVVIEDYNRIGEELKATQAAAAALNQKLGPLEGQLGVARADVGRLAARAYKNGGGLATVSFVLSAGSSATVVTEMEAMARLARSRQRDINAFATTRDAYNKEKKRVEDLLAAQTQQQKQIADRKVKIEAEVTRLTDMERRLQATQPARSTTKNGGSPPPPPPSGSGKGAIAAQFAYAQIGKMYQFGADGPNTYDCSGLTMRAWQQAGVSLPHNARMQYNATAKVSRANLQVGDLVYYNSLGHVGVYIGNDTIVHASRSGKPVAAVPINTSGTPYGYTRPG